MSLPYWIEDTGSNKYIWTKVTIPAKKSIVLYIRKKEGYSPNGDAVFEFFDDFEQLDTNKWIVYRYANDVNNEVVFENGVVYLTKAVGSRAGLLVSKNDIKPPFIVHMRFKIGGGTGADGISFGYMLNDPGGTNRGRYLAFPQGSDIKGYIIAIDEWYDEIEIRMAGSWTTTGKRYPKSDIDDNNWHTISAALTKESVEWVTYDGMKIIEHDSLPSDTGYYKIGLGGATGGSTNNHIVDYIFIRKYIEQDLRFGTISINEF